MMLQLFILAAILLSAGAFTLSTKRSSASLMMMAEKSKALPFLPAPKNLDGLPGNKGTI
jgi:hypothetical protein